MNDQILVGHTIYLRLPTDSDIIDNNWHMWYNDYDTTEYNNHGVFPIDMKDELKFINESKGSSSKIVFAIISKYDDNLIGNCAIQKINLLYRKAQIAITIGDPEYRGRTCALEAIGLIVEHGFFRLNLNRIYGQAHENLDRWITMLEVLGFKKEGLLKQDILRNSKYSDSIIFGLLAEDFFELIKKRNDKILFEDLSLLSKEIMKINNNK